MTPSECRPGMHVSYEPSPGYKFIGIVATLPWKLGDHTWVTKLVDMERKYGEFTGKRGPKAKTVYAAALNNCELVPERPIIWFAPNGRCDRDEWARRYRNEHKFKYIVDSIVANVLDDHLTTDDFRLAVECAVERLQNHLAECATICATCGGDGKETCDNPDHGFIEMCPGDISRLGCPVCGHDPEHKVPNGGDCESCGGTGRVQTGPRT